MQPRQHPRHELPLALLAACAIASVAPLWAARDLPFTDLPEHAAVMATLRHWWDPSWRIPEHYELAVGRSQYLAYHAIGALLTVPLGDARTANAVLLTCVGLAFPLSLRALLRALGRDERLAIFGCALFWSRALVVGLLPYVASVPLVLWGLALAAEQAARPTKRRGVGLAALAVLVFVTHASAMFVLVPIGLAFTWQRGRRGAWVLPSMLLFSAWFVVGRFGAERTIAASVARAGPWWSVPAVPIWAHDVWRGHGDEAAFAVFWIAFLAIALRPARPEGHRGERIPPHAIPLAWTTLLYVLMPFRVGAAVMLDVRLSPFFALFAVLLLAPRADRLTRAAFGGAVVATLATACVAAVEIRRCATEEVAGLEGLLAKVPAGARLMSLTFRTASEATFTPPYGHIGALHRVQHGGVAAFSFASLRHWSVGFRPEAAPPGKGRVFWDYEPCLFRNAVDGPYYDVVLVRGDVDPFAMHPPGPAWRTVGVVKDFTLWEKVPDEAWPGSPADDAGPCAPTSSAAVRY